MASIDLKLSAKPKPWLRYVLDHAPLFWTVGVLVVLLPIPARWLIDFEVADA
jgi:hypothetical protein